MRFLDLKWAVLSAVFGLLHHHLMAQPQSSAGKHWLQSAPPVPEFKAPANIKAWEKQRRQIRTTLRTTLGDLPPRPKVPVVQTISREDRTYYTLERFTFDNGAGDTVPGYLLIPKDGPARKPAILYCHWHGGHYDVGKEELFRTNALPEPPGPALVRDGFVVLAIDAYCFGERNGRGPGGPSERGGAGELSASKFQLWYGRSLWGMMVRDDLMALDYLSAHPAVDPARIGVTGISMGATRTWWIMALDDRPKTGVAVACLTRYQDLIAAEGLKYHGIYYYVPGLLRHFDTEAVVALAAPRPMLFMTGDQDAGSPVSGIRAIDAAVRPIYRLYDAEADFENEIISGLGHVYTPAMWEKTRRWFKERL